MISKRLADEAIPFYGAVRAWLPFILRRPAGIFLYITGRCSLDCHYCWQREELHWSQPWKDSSEDELTPEEWVQVVRSLPSVSYVGLSGGEVTLSPAFPKIIDAAENRFRITVNTNGAVMRDEHLRVLTSPAVHNISISLDGFAEVHNHGRRMEGLFEQIVKNLKRLNTVRMTSRRPSLTIKTVLMDENIEQLSEFRRFCEEELSADTLNISFMKVGPHAQLSLRYFKEISHVFGPEYPELYPYRQPERVVEVMEQLLRDNWRYRCKVTVYPRMHSVEQMRRFIAERGQGVYTNCFMPWAQVVVLPNGEVIPCLAVSLGNLRDYDWRVDNLLKAPKYKMFCQKIASYGGNIPPVCNVCCFLKVR